MSCSITGTNNIYTPSVINGLESLNQALLTVTGQQVAIVVVKVSEQIARIDNPESGLAADDEFIFVGYRPFPCRYLPVCRDQRSVVTSGYLLMRRRLLLS